MLLNITGSGEWYVAIIVSTSVGPFNYLKLLIPQHFEIWVNFCLQVCEREWC